MKEFDPYFSVKTVISFPVVHWDYGQNFITELYGEVFLSISVCPRKLKQDPNIRAGSIVRSAAKYLFHDNRESIPFQKRDIVL